MKFTIYFLLAIMPMVIFSGCTTVDDYVYKHTRFLEDYKMGIHGGADSSSGGSSGSSSGNGGGHSH